MKRFLLLGTGLLFSASLACAQTDAPAPGDAVTAVKDTNLFAMIAAAGWVMIPLAFASVVTITLVIYCLITLRVRAITTQDLLKRMEPFFENEDLTGLAAFVADRPQALARLIDQVLKFLERRPEADGEAITAVAEAEASRIANTLNQRVLYVMDVGVLAPLLGLFGTVVGILSSFGHIAQEASPMRTMLLAGGVSQALISTACGLIVGIVAMSFFAYFRGRVNNMISVLDTEGTLLVQEIILLSKRHTVKKAVTK